MDNVGQFEKLEHHLPGLDACAVPLYLDNKMNLTAETGVLLRSTEIVGAQLGRISLTELLDTVGDVISKPDNQVGLIIEDEDGLGSIKVAPDVTTVSLRKHGRSQIPSLLFFDMLYTWSHYTNDPPKADGIN